MLKEKLLPISIFTLAFAIIISAFIISKGMEANGSYVSSGLDSIANQLNDMNNSSSYYNDENLDLSEAAAYLNISEHQLLELTTFYDPGIPYIKIDGIYIFNKKAIDNYLQTTRIEID